MIGGAFGSSGSFTAPGYAGTNQYAPAQLLQNSQNAANTGIANIQATAAELPAQLQQKRFESVFPMIQGAFGSLSSQLGAGQQTPGSAGGPPAINAGPVWNPAQIQGQVNSQVAQNNANAATQMRNANNQYGSRGIGSGQSPLLAELGAQFQGQGLQANNAAQQGIQWNAAQGNAQQQLAGQQAQQQQYQSGQQNLIAQQQIAAQQRSSLLSALAGLA